MKKLAIIGASSFQNPLIQKAKDMGIETHVFAWASGDVGEKNADFFYPISITEKEEILEVCKKIGVHGIASIGSDLANITVAYVADQMGLVANSIDCVEKSTNKNIMRMVFASCKDPSPKSQLVDKKTNLDLLDFNYPVIVKPSDRSGSRGIAKLESAVGIKKAVENAINESFSKTALIEEFVEGKEYSVEYLSWQGEHRFLSVTEKFTTGAPKFIEMGHLEPARLSFDEVDKIKTVVEHALDSLGVAYGASHSEIKIDPEGRIRIIEIGSRMGGDCIGSNLVQLSTGYDFVKAVIDVALGREPDAVNICKTDCAAIRFVFSEADKQALDEIKKDSCVELVYESPINESSHEIVDSSTRYGYFIFKSSSLKDVEVYLPE